MVYCDYTTMASQKQVAKTEGKPAPAPEEEPASAALETVASAPTATPESATKECSQHCTWASQSTSFSSKSSFQK